jgi:glycosyltransferase involved in cell wall biosynthesis
VISIVIPTYNRADILAECLDRLAHQRDVDGLYDIIIVDDGGSDRSSEVVSTFQKNYPGISVRYFKKENQGQGIARNYGVRQARGDVIIFIGDDILVPDDFVFRHLEFHRNHPEKNAGLLGFIEWDHRLPDTPLYTFLTNGSIILGRFGGHQFAFEKLEGRSKASYDFFYTSNISLKRELLLEEPFDENFLAYGWEDIELGYRLMMKHGFRLYFDKNVSVAHYHPMTEDALKKRMYVIGKSIVLFDQKYPELGKIPRGVKYFLFFVFGSTPMVGFFSLMKNIFGGAFHYWYYFALSKRCFLLGLQDGIKSL